MSNYQEFLYAILQSLYGRLFLCLFTRGSRLERGEDRVMGDARHDTQEAGLLFCLCYRYSILGVFLVYLRGYKLYFDIMGGWTACIFNVSVKCT